MFPYRYASSEKLVDLIHNIVNAFDSFFHMHEIGK